MSEVFATREQLEVLFRNIDGGVTVIAADGTFAYANENAARLIGFESADALLQAGAEAAVSGYELFRPDGTPLPREELPTRIALTTSAPAETTVHFRPTGGGVDRISVVRAAPVLDAAGNVQFVVSFFREITEDRRRAVRQAFIAEAGGLLGSSLDYEATLRTVASLAVPRLADLCTVDLIGEGRLLERVGDAAVEPHSDEPPSLDDARGPGAVAGTGEREVAASSVSVPIEARGRILGVITLGFAASGRQPDDDDVELVEDLARRAGIAIDNALLFRETRGSEAILDALFESAPVGLGFWDRDLRYVRVNDALAEINGIPVDGHIGRELREVLPDLDESTYDVFRRVLETGDPVRDVEVFGATPAQPGVRRA